MKQQKGLNIASNGVLMVIDFSGKFNGEAFVRFSSMVEAHNALDRHKEKIGTRFVYYFNSKMNLEHT
jgi:RNA recognition motif-containing protein